jgi:hypothetical protein
MERLMKFEASATKCPEAAQLIGGGPIEETNLTSIKIVLIGYFSCCAIVGCKSDKLRSGHRAFMFRLAFYVALI